MNEIDQLNFVYVTIRPKTRVKALFADKFVRFCREIIQVR